MCYANLQVFMNTETVRRKNCEIHLPELRERIALPSVVLRYRLFKLIHAFNYFCHSSCSLQWNCSFCLEIIIIFTKLTLSDGRTGPLISFAQWATTLHNPGQSDVGFPARRSRPNRPRSFSDSWHCPNRSAWRHRRLHMMVSIAWTWVFWDIPDDREDANDYLETRLSNASPSYCEHLRAMKVCSHKRCFLNKRMTVFFAFGSKECGNDNGLDVRTGGLKSSFHSRLVWHHLFWYD